MEFWDQTVTATKKFISVAEKKTEEIINLQKLNFKISSTQSKINEKYCALGKSIYKTLENEPSVQAADFADQMVEISVLKKELQELVKELDNAKGKVNCPNCNTGCNTKDKFCHKCGIEL